MCSSAIFSHKIPNLLRFPISPSLVLAALLCVAGPAQAQQTFFIDTVAGPSWPYPDYPTSVAVASDGTIYLADRDSHTVLRVETDGSLSVFAGTEFAGFSGDGDAAAAAQLNTPTGVAVTADDGTVYIADRANNRIRKVEVATRIITTVAGTGSAGFSGDGGSAAAAVLNLPIDVAVDGDGNVYIADLDNHRIRKVTVATGVIDTIAGSGPFGFGQGGYGGDNGPATAARLNNPVSVEVDGDGNVYIGDFSNHRVRKVDVSMDPPTISAVAGNGTTGFSGDDGQATAAQLANPYGVAVADDGTVYIADATNHRVRKVATDGVITTVAGGATSFNIYVDNIQATEAELVDPRDVALDSSGNFYIAARGLNNQGAIRKVDTSGVITTVAGGWTLGFSGDGGPAKAARLSAAAGVAVDSSGNVYIADHGNNRIRKVDTSGIITTFASTGISGPRGLAVDSADNVYVAQYHRILKIDGSTDPPTITTVAGGGSPGFSGDGGAATAAWLDEPRGVAIDSNGDIYIADSRNNRVRKVDVSANPPTISTIAGTGTSGFSGDGGAATAARLNGPYDVAIDSDGDVYIACYFNNRIRKVDVSATPPTISTFAGSSSNRDFSGDGRAATAARLNRPYDVEVASDGTVYIADANNHRIRAVATDGTINTVAGTGMGITLPGVPDGGPATAATVYFPRKVAVDSDGNVYIAWSNLVSVLTTNGLPRARDASSTTPPGTPVTINLRVSDPNSDDMLTVTVTTPSSNGMTTVSGLIILYTPNTGFTGVDTFEYTVSDGQGGSTTATVRVGVGAPPPPPPPPPPPRPTTGGGGSRPRDDHGNTAARASQVRLNTRTHSATTSGSLQTAGDVDYFELTVPDAGILFVETTGSTNTIGTLWRDDRVLGHALEGGSGRNFWLGVSVQPGQVVIAVQGFGRATGRYSLRTTFVAGQLENPSPNSFQSGISTLSGWVCDADEVVLEINGTPFSAAYGTDRADTAETAAGEDLCGDTDNGFGLLFNWNELGNGRHEVVALVDEVELSRTTVTVTTLCTAFLREASGTCEAADFPSTGENVTLVWQEAKQNFVLTDGSAPPTGNTAVESAITGYLENPAPNSFQSGLGPLSGWVCEADEVTLEINGQTVEASYGTERADTAETEEGEELCGDTDNGFGVVFNWSELDDGDYEVIARADGVAFDRATVRVTTLGTTFLEDVTGTCEATDFPETGETVTLTWQEAQQNFVITDVQ